MSNVTKDDLILLYYGEHDDPGLAARVADSPELSEQFEGLCRVLEATDSFQPPEPGDAYGADVWQAIESKLTPVARQRRGWFVSLLQPRFSMAGVFSLAAIAVLAFLMGRTTMDESQQPVPNLLAGIDSGKVFTHSVSNHLDQLNVGLTRFASSEDVAANDADWATEMLVSNRLYRRAADAQGNENLARLLAELEPLLIELAYEAYTDSAPTLDRMQREVQDGLLFKVRVMNSQLKNSGISI